jgi:hypothetical protein
MLSSRITTPFGVPTSLVESVETPMTLVAGPLEATGHTSPVRPRTAIKAISLVCVSEIPLIQQRKNYCFFRLAYLLRF